MRVVGADDPSLRLLVQYLSLCKPGHAAKSPDLAHAMAAHVRDLVALAMGSSG